MAFQDLLDDVHDICVDVLGESASLTDGAVTVSDLAGFYRPTWDESTSNRFGFMAEAPTWECRVSDMASFDLTTVGGALVLTYGGKDYVVMDKRDDHGMTLLVLQR